MKKTEFLIELEDILQREEPCIETDKLSDYEEWDSLSQMALVAYFEKFFNKKLSMNDLQKLTTVSDLISLAGVDICD